MEPEAQSYSRRAGRGNRQPDMLAAPFTQKVCGRHRVRARGSKEKSNRRKRASC